MGKFLLTNELHLYTYTHILLTNVWHTKNNISLLFCLFGIHRGHLNLDCNWKLKFMQPYL